MATLFDSYTTNDDNVNAPNGTTVYCQTFTASASYSLTSIKLKLARVGTPGTCYAKIYATTASKPSGDALSSASFSGDTLTTDSNVGEWLEISTPSINLSSGIKYAIVVSAPDGNGLNSLNWRNDETSSAYAGGGREYSSNAGSTWTSESATIDCMFETYGDEIVADSSNFFQLF